MFKTNSKSSLRQQFDIKQSITDKNREFNLIYAIIRAEVLKKQSKTGYTYLLRAIYLLVKNRYFLIRENHGSRLLELN